MRDYSPLANRAFKGQVPEALTGYLAKHRKALHPAIRQAWEANGSKRQGTWEEVFGKGQPSSGTDEWLTEFPYLTEEIFMAWHYATYVGYIAAQGKQEYPLPMYVNAWLKQSGGREPGRYPSGGPLPHVFDIWRAAAPGIDFFSPDIYAIDIFDETCSSYTTGGNPLFIPETKADRRTSMPSTFSTRPAARTPPEAIRCSSPRRRPMRPEQPAPSMPSGDIAPSAMLPSG